MSSVQVWRAGKFYYQSTPSSGALPTDGKDNEPTTPDHRSKEAGSRHHDWLLLYLSVVLVDVLTSRSIYMHVVCFWHGKNKLLVQILVSIWQKFIEKKNQFNGYVVSVYHIYLRKSSKCSSLSGNYMWLFISFWLVWLNFYSFARMTGMHLCLYYLL